MRNSRCNDTKEIILNYSEPGLLVIPLTRIYHDPGQPCSSFPSFPCFPPLHNIFPGQRTQSKSFPVIQRLDSSLLPLEIFHIRNSPSFHPFFPAVLRSARRVAALSGAERRSVEARRLFRLRTQTFDISFPNRVTVVSPADKALLITAPGFHELKLFPWEQIRRRPRLAFLFSKKLKFRAFSAPLRSNGLFDRVTASLLWPPAVLRVSILSKRVRANWKGSKQATELRNFNDHPCDASYRPAL